MPVAMRIAAIACVLGVFVVCGVLMAAIPASAQSRNSDDVTTRAPRPRVVIQPRRAKLSPNARRECRARLVQEYRVSGPVIVPQMTCWWE